MMNTYERKANHNVVRCSYFTLLELLVVIAIMGIVSGTTILGINGLLDDQRFRSGVSFIVDRLQEAQEIMLVYNTDVIVRLTHHEQGVICALDVEKMVPFTIEDKTIKGIERLEFKGESYSENEGVWSLWFISGGSKMTEGILKLEGRHGQKRYVYLRGYPSAIVDTSKEPTWLPEKKSDEENEALYPLAL